MIIRCKYTNMFERFRRNRGRQSEGTNSSPRTVGEAWEQKIAAEAALVAARERQPKPCRLIITSEDTPPDQVVEMQRRAIEKMLADDQTEKGQVVVLVKNPLWEGDYAQSLESAVDRGLTYTQAVHEAYTEKWIYVPDGGNAAYPPTLEDIEAAIERTQTPIERATGVMLDKLQEQYKGRIIIRAQDIQNGSSMRVAEERAKEGFTFNSSDYGRQTSIDRTRENIGYNAAAFEERDKTTANNLAHTMWVDKAIGVVGAIEVQDLSILGAIADQRHPIEDRDLFMVDTEYAPDGHFLLTPEALLIQRAQMGGKIEDIDIELAADSKAHFAGMESAPEYNKARLDWINAEREKRLAEKAEKDVLKNVQGLVDGFDTDYAESFARQQAVIEIRDGSGKELSAAQREKVREARSMVQAFDVFKAYQMLTHGYEPTDDEVRRGAEIFAAHIRIMQDIYDSRIRQKTEAIINERLAFFDGPFPNSLGLAARAEAERMALEEISAIAGKEILDVHAMGAAYLESTYTDPIGTIKRTQEHANPDGIILERDAVIPLKVAFDTGEGASRTHKERARELRNQSTARDVTNDILLKKGYYRPAHEDISRHAGETQGQIHALQWHYEQEIARLTSRWLDAFDNPTPTNRIQVRAAAEKVVLDSIREITGSSTVEKSTHEVELESKNMGEHVLRAAIKDPEGMKQRAEVYQERMQRGKEEGDESVVEVAHNTEMTVDAATGAAIPTERAYYKALRRSLEAPEEERELQETGERERAVIQELFERIKEEAPEVWERMEASRQAAEDPTGAFELEQGTEVWIETRDENDGTTDIFVVDGDQTHNVFDQDDRGDDQDREDDRDDR
jgi:hypothetical protein